MVIRTLAVWLLLQPALLRAQGVVVHKIGPKSASACIKAWVPELEKSLPDVTKLYWTQKCETGMTPKEILEEAKKAPKTGIQLPKLGQIALPMASLKSATAVKALTGTISKVLAAGDPAMLYGEKSGNTSAVAGGGGPAAQTGPKPSPVNTADSGTGAVARIMPPAPAKTDPCAAAKPYSASPSWYDAMSTRIACMPGVPYRKALTAYLDMTGLQHYGGESVGGSNSGLNHFNKGLAKDPEFAKQVMAFYAAVEARDPKYADRNGYGKAGLDRTAGTGKNASLPAGWAWKEALVVAKGDPNQAMRLIGHCGHDDLSQATLTRTRTDEEAGKLLAEKREANDAELKGLEDALAIVKAEKKKDSECLLCLIYEPDSLNKQITSLRLRRASLELADFKIDRFFKCPYSTSPFYLPRSLDAKADISDKLKTDIAAAQKKKPEDIAAKYYHVMAGAAAACEMIRNGAPGWIAETVQGESAWVYRTLRMKTDAKDYLQQRQELQNEYALYHSRLGLKKGEEPRTEEQHRDLRNEKLSTDGGKISFSRMDAFELMELWGYGGTILGMEIPPVDFRLGWLKGSFLKRKPEGWSDKRFTAAKDRMQTFFVDWEWTKAQHEAGAAFAKKVCKEQP